MASQKLTPQHLTPLSNILEATVRDPGCYAVICSPGNRPTIRKQYGAVDHRRLRRAAPLAAVEDLVARFEAGSGAHAGKIVAEIKDVRCGNAVRPPVPIGSDLARLVNTLFCLAPVAHEEHLAAGGATAFEVRYDRNLVGVNLDASLIRRVLAESGAEALLLDDARRRFRSDIEAVFTGIAWGRFKIPIPDSLSGHERIAALADLEAFRHRRREYLRSARRGSSSGTWRALK